MIKDILFVSNYAKELAENLYECTVPELAVTEPEFIRSFGVFTTGFDDADKQLSNRRSRVMLTIPVMVAYFVDGIDFDIVQDHEVMEIHELVTNYLAEWHNEVNDGINLRVSDYEESLKNLTEFSVAIYDLLEDQELFVEQEEVPEMFIRALDINDTQEERRRDFKRNDYHDVYGDMFDVLRERRDFEN